MMKIISTEVNESQAKSQQMYALGLAIDTTALVTSSNSSIPQLYATWKCTVINVTGHQSYLLKSPSKGQT